MGSPSFYNSIRKLGNRSFPLTGYCALSGVLIFIYNNIHYQIQTNYEVQILILCILFPSGRNSYDVIKKALLLPKKDYT